MVLFSLALVSGLMVVCAKNPVHSVLFSIPVFRDTSGLLLLLGLDFSAMIFPVVHIQIPSMGMFYRVGKPIRAKALSGVRRLCLFCGLLLLVRPLVRLLCGFLYCFLCSKVLGSGTLEQLAAFQLAFYGDSLESSGGLIIYKAPSPGGQVEILEIPESPSNPGPSQRAAQVDPCSTSVVPADILYPSPSMPPSPVSSVDQENLWVEVERRQQDQGPAAPQENAPPAGQVPPFSHPLTHWEQKSIETRVSLERAFENKARDRLAENGVPVDDPEDVKRVSSIFFDEWSIPEFRRKLQAFANPNSRVLKDFLAAFRDFTNE